MPLVSLEGHAKQRNRPALGKVESPSHFFCQRAEFDDSHPVRERERWKKMTLVSLSLFLCFLFFVLRLVMLFFHLTTARESLVGFADISFSFFLGSFLPLLAWADSLAEALISSKDEAIDFSSTSFVLFFFF